MNFNWIGNESSSSGVAEFKLRNHPTVTLRLNCFTDAVHLSELMDQFKQDGIKEGQTRLLDSLHFDLRMEAKKAMESMVRKYDWTSKGWAKQMKMNEVRRKEARQRMERAKAEASKDT